MEKNSKQTNTLSLEKINIKKIIVILLAITITCSIVVTGVIIYAPRSEGYNVMYLLNAQDQIVNHPQILIINQNNTFNTKSVVENNKPTTYNYQVQVKIVKDTFNFPINTPTYETYEFTLNPKQTWNNQVPISIKEEGEFSIVFELYVEKEENYRFTNNYCVLHITAITDTS